MADGTSFEVDLAALGHAIDRVSGEREAMHGGITSLRSTFRNIEDHWKSPAGNSFPTLATNFNSVSDNLMAVLDDAISRMRKAHQLYAATEATNKKNLSTGGSHGGGSHGGGSHGGGSHGGGSHGGGSGAPIRPDMVSGGTALTPATAPVAAEAPLP